MIFPVLVVPISNNAGRNIGGENALTTLAQRTGGRVFAPTVGKEMDQAFDGILRDLRTQYLLGFYPKDVPPTKERFHTLDGDRSGARGFVMADFGAQWILWRGVACGGCFARFIG